MGVAAEPASGIARDLAKSFCAGAAVDQLVPPQEKRQAVRKSEDQVQIAGEEKFASAPKSPRSLRGHLDG